MEIMAGTWTSALLSRRPLMVILHRIYQVRADNRLAGVRLPRDAASELAMMAAIAPLIVSDLRAPYSSDLYATDVSPTGGAVTVMSGVLAGGAADAVWRRRGRRGGYSRLEDPVIEAAQAYGVIDDLAPLFSLEDWRVQKETKAERPVAQKWDCLIILQADERFLEVLTELGIRWGPVVSRARKSFYDLNSLRCLEWLVFLMRERRVRFWIFDLPARLFDPNRPRPQKARRQAGLFWSRIWHLARLVGRMRTAAMLIMQQKCVEHPEIQASLSQRRVSITYASASACSFGAPFGREFALYGFACDVAPLHRPCAGCAAHVPEGGVAQREAEPWWPSFSL